MRQPRTTLAEVAEAAGVSVATASKVLNDRADVSPETRRRVQKQLRESSYRQPTRSAEGARNRRGLIEVVFPIWQSGYLITVLEGIMAGAEAEGYEVVIGRRPHVDSMLVPSVLLKNGRAGAVFVTVDAASDPVRTLIATGFPVVLVDPVRVRGAACASVGATNFTGGMTATQHLLDLGHRHIGHAGGPQSVDGSEARVSGYLSALRQAGEEIDESLIIHSDFTYEGGRAAAHSLLDRPDRPSAIFAASDEIALGVMEEARRRSIRVPEDLSIVGFDGTFLASRSTPPLTTVAQPLHDMGRIALRTLVEQIQGQASAGHVELATHFVLRDSTSPPPGTATAEAAAAGRKTPARRAPTNTEELNRLGGTTDRRRSSTIGRAAQQRSPRSLDAAPSRP